MTAELTSTSGSALGGPDALDAPAADRLEVVPGRFEALRALPVSGRAIDLATFGVALVIGSWLRLTDLGSVGVNSDEAVYAGQAASIAGNEHFLANFPIVRAHPLLFQLLIAPWYTNGVPDTPGRYASAFFGIGTIALVFALGYLTYGRRAGAIAALLMAVMPYAVVLSRQVLLDGPMTFFTTASLVCLALLARTENGRWLVAAGALLGLATLTKETAVILVMAVFAFLSLVPRFWRPKRYVALAAVAALGLAAAYPLSTSLAGGGSKGQSYVAWQLSRRPNHDFLFYLTDIPVAIGILTVVTAIAGLILLRRRSSWREVLLLAWI
ncbi:MAG TPA: glycosyltransferase family 39 protein, partial [Candidatus Nanopelagicales bacterium]|nr:glycosyltransferase family 39 protein [Candidatus Nanopelagicales bacterium]